MVNSRRSFVWAAALTCSVLAVPVHAQSFPGKAVRIVVPFPPGGGVDVLVRSLAVELGAKWKQPVVVDNKTGAGGVIGADFVAKAPSDGYTLLATTNPIITSSRFLFKSLPFDPEKSFDPLVLVAGADQFLVASNALPAANLRELVNYAKSNPGKVAYGSDGNGSKPQQIFGMISAMEHLDTTHVAYRGIAPAMTALLADEVQLSAASAGVVGPFLKAGKMKALAVAGSKRSALFPAVPTAAEQGFAAVKSQIFYGLYAPAGLPPAVAAKIVADVTEILKQPQFIQQNATDKGLQMHASGPAELAAAIRDDVASSGAMIRAAKIQPE